MKKKKTAYLGKKPKKKKNATTEVGMMKNERKIFFFKMIHSLSKKIFFPKHTCYAYKKIFFLLS